MSQADTFNASQILSYNVEESKKVEMHSPRS